jgi:NADH-quinone oxidoreductase subunit C
MLQFNEIFDLIKNNCTHGEAVADENATPKIVKISSQDLKRVCRMLYENASTYFDMLACITGIDNGPQPGTIEVVYNLYSIPYNHHVALKVVVSRDNPVIESVIDIWKTANWHERELFDMYGIHVTGHPDLRRILMPADWEGYPLRKDYKQQEYYRDIKVEY